MKRIFLMTLAITLAACSQRARDPAEPKSSALPSKFVLDCAAPKQFGTQIIPGMKNGFKVDVDLSTKRFSVPWDKVRRPIKTIDRREIVFAHVDSNPMAWEMKFDVPSGQLFYHSAAVGVIYVSEIFSARCQVVPHA